MPSKTLIIETALLILPVYLNFSTRQELRGDCPGFILNATSFLPTITTFLTLVWNSTSFCPVKKHSNRHLPKYLGCTSISSACFPLHILVFESLFNLVWNLPHPLVSPPTELWCLQEIFLSPVSICAAKCH